MQVAYGSTNIKLNNNNQILKLNILNNKSPISETQMTNLVLITKI